MSDEILPAGEPLDRAILRFVPELLPPYQAERERHRAELKAIDDLKKRARRRLKQCFRGPVLDHRLRELQDEYAQRVEAENDRHDRFLQELRDTIRDYATPGWEDENSPEAG